MYSYRPSANGEPQQKKQQTVCGFSCCRTTVPRNKLKFICTHFAQLLRPLHLFVVLPDQLFIHM
jgi:hypothetical protein